MTMSLKDISLLKSTAYLGGAWVGADDGHVIEVTNPATGAVLGNVPDMGAGEARRAIEAAHAALPEWRDRTGKDRAALLRRWFDLVIANTDDLALIMVSEQGKPLAEAKGEIAYAASFIEWFGEEAKRTYGDIIPGYQPDKRLLVLKQPVGVCAAITPWNFPAAMLTRKAAPALAAGCTMVVKPASQTPLTALALCALAERAGIPPGVLSCITGNAAEIGEEMTSNPLVRKISFTGSTEIGRRLAAASAGTIKRLSLELGGNAPFIVLDDADVDTAVAGAIISKYRNAGQTCVCANRFLVQAGVHDEFVEKLSLAVAGLRVGEGTEQGVDIGPLIDDKAVAKVEALLADAAAKGGNVRLGGKRHALGGTFFEPTVISGARRDMALFEDEIFGPVAPVFRFESDQEGVALANDTIYGLAAYLYGSDLARLWRVGEALEYGMVGVNTGHISTEVAPFGGIKQSGIGREGSYHGIEEYLDVKYMALAI
ncbi:MAG: succinate-semialdehyde dehydrogenase (NADP(+)) [Pelagibacterium sp. SCN 64-44]|nr:MAG: succinate-semialdehyde dehydrogenase (NADP(+)) [Pelagibacterium sp. SCN 64-44]